MSDQKRHWKKHICAAKEWLGRAEKSLDADNSLRSDLNVMLAQAELQRAKETGTKQFSGKIYRTFFAVITAALIFSLGLWNGIFPFANGHFSSDQKKSGDFAVQDHPPVTVPSVVSVKTIKSIADTPALEVAEHQSTTTTLSTAEPNQQSDGTVSVQKQPEVREVKNVTVSTAKVPTEKVQKLMRDAGKTLRAQ